MIVAIDARKHVAPAAAETPRRQALNDLSLSIRDFVPVANATERAQIVADLSAAGTPVSATNPLVVIRADAPVGAPVEISTDGSAWRSVYSDDTAAWTPVTLDGGLVVATGYPSMAFRLERGGTQVRLRGTRLVYSPTINVAAGGANSIAVVTPLPAAARPAAGSRFKMMLSGTAATLNPGQMYVTTSGTVNWRSLSAITEITTIEWEDMVWQV